MKRTALYDEHIKLGARMVDFAGWEMPVQYSGVIDEHRKVRESAGIFDVSHMGTFEIKGKDALKFLNYLLPTNIESIDDMKAHYSMLLTEKGTIIDDIIVYRLAGDHFLMVVNAGNREKDETWIRKNIGNYDAEFTNISSNIVLMAIQGPLAARILGRLTDTDLSMIPRFGIGRVRIGGSKEMFIARTGYTGEDGFEIFSPISEAKHVWTSILSEGARDGLVPAGLGARDTLRLEMKYPLYGHEISEETNPIEAGLKWVVDFRKGEDFIGKGALSKVLEEGTKRRLVGFRMIESGIPRQNYKIKRDGLEIGFVTSGTFSPSLNIPIGIGYVRTEFSEIGTKFSIDIRGKERQAEVIKTPFYQNRR